MLASLLEAAVRLYEYYLWTLTFADWRVEKWPLMSSPIYTIVLVLVYLLAVWLGPRLMEHRQPFQLKPLLIAYNLAMAALNFYIMVELFYSTWQADYSYICQPVAHTTDVWEARVAAALWWFYASKLLEFSETFFFVLRKKRRQLSFLHVYHHASMFCFWWIGVNGACSAFLGAMMNSFVHTLMYVYYAAAAAATYDAALSPCKKWLTALQLTQFCVAIVMTANGLYIDCPFPRWMGFTLIGYMVSFIVLFGNFCLHAYISRPPSRLQPKLSVSWPCESAAKRVNGFVLPADELRRRHLRQ